MMSVLTSLEAILPATSTIVAAQNSGQRQEEMLLSDHDPKTYTIYSVEEISHCQVPAQTNRHPISWQMRKNLMTTA